MAKGKTKKRPGQQKDPRTKIISACLKLAVDKDWGEVGLGEIAEAAKMPLREVHKYFRSKNAVLKAFSQQVDTEVLANSVSVGSDATARDRLFEIIMRRFDVLSPYKHGLRAVIRGFCHEPISGLCSCVRVHASMQLMLETVGIGSTGFQGELKARGLAIIYANSLRVWLNDESPDLAVTMAALDRGLMRAEQIMGLLKLGGEDQSWRDHK